MQVERSGLVRFLHNTVQNEKQLPIGHRSENSIINLKEAAAGNYEHFRLKVYQTEYFGHYILHGEDTRLHIADKNFKDRKTNKKRKKKCKQVPILVYK